MISAVIFAVINEPEITYRKKNKRALEEKWN